MFFSGKGGPGDKSQDGNETNNQGKGEQDKEDSLSIWIIPDPSLEGTDQDSTADKPGKGRRQGIDHQVGPEGGTHGFNIFSQQHHIIIDGLADGEEHPYPRDPQNFPQFTFGPENLKKMRCFRTIRVFFAHDDWYDSNTKVKVG